MTVTRYHRHLLDYFQQDMTAVWNWFSGAKHKAAAADKARLDLLKSAYRLDRETSAVLYLQCDALQKKMGVSEPVYLYQAQYTGSFNATLVWLPGEIHVVLHGAVQDLLNEREMEALLAHELTHFELLTTENGVFFAVEEILNGLLDDPASYPAHLRTYRNYRLYTELLCDRRAADLTEDVEACVRMLVKMETGLKDVSAAAYLQQAEEILGRDSEASDGITHPEMYIRAHALQLWTTDPESCDEAVAPLIEGPLSLKTLDVLQQRLLTEATTDFLKAFLNESWLQTSITLGHARQYMEDFRFSDESPSAEVSIPEADQQVKEYFCYVLLDFATCDPDLEEAPLAAAFLLASKVGILEQFRTSATRELNIGKRALQRIEKDAARIVEAARKELAT